MKSKLTLFVVLAVFTVFSAQASFPMKEVAIDRNSPNYVNDDMSKLMKGNVVDFLKMTPKQFEKMTGNSKRDNETKSCSINVEKRR